MDEKRLLRVLENALRVERDGHQFYTMAAKASGDSGAKDVFSNLAEEERRHFDALQTEYRAILEGAGWDANVVLGARWNPEKASGIFSNDFRRRIMGRHIEMSSLSIGILLEKNAQAFYQAAADEEEDTAVREFLRDLAEWESGHYEILVREDAALRDAYWDENRFSPLL